MADENNNQQGTDNNQQEKTFTQAEVDALIGRRIAKLTKGMPSDDELSEFRAWKDKKPNNDAEMQTLRNDLAAANEKLTQYEREALLTAKGVRKEDVDYYSFKIGKMVDDKTTFEQAMETFLKDNPVRGVKMNTSASFGGNEKELTANQTMNALIRGAR